MFHLLSRDLIYRSIYKVAKVPRLNKSGTSLAKLKKLQADFQREDGNPIWLKRGFTDRVLYTSTLIGCVLGIVMVLGCIYDNAKPESWKNKE